MSENRPADEPYGNPTSEFMSFKGYDKPRDIDLSSEVSNHDLLIAILRSADAVYHELREIRRLLSSKSP